MSVILHDSSTFVEGLTHVLPRNTKFDIPISPNRADAAVLLSRYELERELFALRYRKTDCRECLPRPDSCVCEISCGTAAVLEFALLRGRLVCALGWSITVAQDIVGDVAE